MMWRALHIFYQAEDWIRDIGMTGVQTCALPIYVPAVINGDSAWLMLDTGLSRTGLDLDWARNVGIVPGPEPGEPTAPAASTAAVDRIRLGELTPVHYRVALYPLTGLSEASGRRQAGLVGHDARQHSAGATD